MSPETTPLARIEVLSIGRLAQRGRWRTEAMRSHANPRLLWFTRGQGRLTIAGQTRGYGAHNLLFVPAGTLFGYEAGPQSQGTELSLPTDMAEDWPEEPVHLRLRDVLSQKEMTGHLDNLEREAASDRPGADRAARLHAGLLAVFLDRQLDEAGDAGLPETSASRIAAAYSDLVARDFRSGRGVADYARALGVTPTHLARCCRRAAGRSAHALLQDRILFEARRELAETDRPVGHIAAGLGFRSPAYFTRAFQAKTGLSPSAFRGAT